MRNIVGAVGEGPQQGMLGIKVGSVHWSQDRLLTVAANGGPPAWDHPGGTEPRNDLRVISLTSTFRG